MEQVEKRFLPRYAYSLGALEDRLCEALKLTKPHQHICGNRSSKEGTITIARPPYSSADDVIGTVNSHYEDLGFKVTGSKSTYADAASILSSILEGEQIYQVIVLADKSSYTINVYKPLAS
ncbi:MAG: hypothetical protein V1839_01990 [archaeon]